MRRHLRCLSAVLCVVAVAGGCRRGARPRERGELTPAEKAVVAAFTSGTISRESPIRVVFQQAVARAEQLGAPLDSSPFRFEPRIKGVAVWAARDRIEFRPAERLPDAQTYAASLDLRALFPAGQAPFARFDLVFSTMKQSFDVAVEGLESRDTGDVKNQALTGRLVTADVEDAPAVEKTLRASHAGRDLPVAWVHAGNRRIHAFTVSGVVRAEQASVLRLSWDGGPIGVDRKDSREVTVPGLDTFTVDQARVVPTPDPHVELRFTDPLKPGQNLRGLVRVGGRDDLRFVVDGSRVEVYGAKGWRGEQTVRVEAGIRNVLGYRMKQARELTVQFELLKPAARFAGKGVVLPTSAGFTVPVEAVNLRSVTVEATLVPSSNMPQFLQVNPLDGEQELRRVGRVVWSKTLSLDLTADKENRWLPVGLDVSPLLAKSPGGMYRLTLSFRRPQVAWPCPAAKGGAEPEPTPLPAAGDEQEESYWDLWAESEAGNWEERFENRDNPCHPAYYQRFYDHDIRAARNVLVSDLGLLAKAGEDDTVLVFVTDLRSTAPVAGAEVTLLDYQQQTLAAGRTDRDGLVRLAVARPAFLATVRQGGQTGYLRLDGGSALPVAHFDVAGARAPKGLKGFLYGERGIWRPGDTLHLTFILHDPAKRLAADHPVRLDLLDPRGQLVRTVNRTLSTEGFYAFDLATAPDAPTGNYTARASVGGATFEKTLKVETVMPNRLKIAMDFGASELGAGRIGGLLTSAWLHGAPARGLKADVELALSPARTTFPKYEEFVFDDPTRKYATERQKIFEGRLDETGRARVDAAVQAQASAPGKLRADLTTRVFEPGGAFSVDRFSVPYSPYPRYVGIRTPKGDRTRGMLLTDTKHRVDLVLLNAAGEPAGDGELEVRLYKVDWRWWWEKGEENLAAWADASVHTPLSSGVAKVAGGKGTWEVEVKYPDWGRYLVVAADRAGGHRAGKVLYIDWPGWAGRGQKEGGPGATVLAFAPDKAEYAPGETVTLSIPTPRKGRGLVSLESGTRVLRTEWIGANGQETRFSFTATPDMAPNVYVHVTLLQPHAQTANDLPIRLYGVAPVKVVDPKTRLQPIVDVPAVLRPETTSTINVREASGRPMAYTIAVVDEGLLGLTRFQTPNPWDAFYAREALAVRTWDLYDDVIGAYGAAMERMLAIGGDEGGGRPQGRRANRFPPMVRFLGPFRLAANATGTHQVDIPQYVGAVRVMVVAGKDGAFGAAERSAFVRRPLMLLATLPRVLGPEETVALPVSVFALEPQVKTVALSLQTSGPLEVAAEAKKTMTFLAVGDDVAEFRLRTKPGLGVATATVTATSGKEKAAQRIELDVRSSTTRVVDVVGGTIKPGEAWTPPVALPGLAGTNAATLEVSRVPPIDLGRRLEYLIAYPHGCVEQTVSAAFPQLYLGKLLELDAEKQSRAEANVKAAIERLRRFQATDGGFGYWPGDDDSADWATNYVGHFAVEAQKAGYLPPAGLLDQWTAFQRRRARAWVPGAGQLPSASGQGVPWLSSQGTLELTQAYRLFTLALAGAPELAAMNQLRERPSLPVAARWRLAAAYQIAGQPEAARALAGKAPVTVAPYRELGGTYGSDLRDRAMVLEAVVLLDMAEHVGPLARSLSESLSKNAWLSTQETAYALLALSKALGGAKGDAGTAFSFEWAGGTPTVVTSASPVVERTLKVGTPAPKLVVRNTGTSTLYPRLILSGTPTVGHETAAASGLALDVKFLTPDDKPLDPQHLAQGTDFKAVVKVTNTGARGDYPNVALSHVVASGWEIRNDRLDPSRARATSPFDYQDVRDDRVYTYFSLKAGETKAVELALNASYLGRFYAPMVTAEAMYDATLNARARGQWVEVVEPGK